MKITNDNILYHLYKEVPEFEESRDIFFDDSKMIQLGIFERFMMNRMNLGSSDDFLRRGYGFFNKMAEFGDEVILDNLTTGVFLSMKGHGEEYVSKVRKYLSKKAIELLDSVNT